MAELKRLVDKVLSDNKEKFYTQKELINEIKNIKITEDGENSYSHKSLQSTVSKRLAELQKNGIAIKIDKKYAYKTPKNIHYIVRDEICSKVTFFKSTVFIASSNVIIVPVTGTTVSIAKELFREYYGEKGFYDALFIDNYLFMMIDTETIGMDIKEIAKDIEDIIKESKEFESNRKEYRLQLQHSRIMQDLVTFVKLSSEKENN